MVTVAALICAAAILLPLVVLALAVPGLIGGVTSLIWPRGRLLLLLLRPPVARCAGPALRRTKQRQSEGRERHFLAHLFPPSRFPTAR
jgi:hypothetical protein